MICKQAAIYARVSTDDQAKGYSLATQIDACQQYAMDSGYSIAGTFTDDYSGATLDRPGLNQLREVLVKQPIDVVVIYDIDRLAQKSVYQMLIEEEFGREGARTEYVIGN